MPTVSSLVAVKMTGEAVVPVRRQGAVDHDALTPWSDFDDRARIDRDRDAAGDGQGRGHLDGAGPFHG